MSYDLAVYTREALGPPELAQLIASVGTLAVEHAADGSCTVLRGARRNYSFTVEGPDEVQAEDLPEEVTATLLGARYLWSVAVEGTTASEIPHAVRFARRLAQALDGAVVDQQTDEIWSRSKSRAIAKPEREDRVSIVEVDLYCLAEEVVAGVIDAFLDAAAKCLPEALPRRFGGYEPLQGKYDEVGRDGFKAAWAAEDMFFLFKGSGVCSGGSLSPPPASRFSGKYWNLSLTFHAAPLQQPEWRDGLRALVLSLVDELPVFYGSAEVVRGWIWSGRTLWADGETEDSIRPVLRRPDRWAGLPPAPTWWTYLGAPYAEYAQLLPAEQTTATRHGHLFEAAPEPASRDQLQGLGAWLPADLFARLLPNPHHERPTPIAVARRVPSAIS